MPMHASGLGSLKDQEGVHHTLLDCATTLIFLLIITLQKLRWSAKPEGGNFRLRVQPQNLLVTMADFYREVWLEPQIIGLRSCKS